MNLYLKFIIFIVFIFAIMCGSFWFTIFVIDTYGAEAVFQVLKILGEIVIALNIVVIVISIIYIINKIINMKKKE